MALHEKNAALCSHYQPSAQAYNDYLGLLIIHVKYNTIKNYIIYIIFDTAIIEDIHSHFVYSTIGLNVCIIISFLQKCGSPLPLYKINANNLIKTQAQQINANPIYQRNEMAWLAFFPAELFCAIPHQHNHSLRRGFAWLVASIMFL